MHLMTVKISEYWEILQHRCKQAAKYTTNNQYQLSISKRVCKNFQNLDNFTNHKESSTIQRIQAIKMLNIDCT
jgi:hypothetical protein